jgi:hypothetical protein
METLVIDRRAFPEPVSSFFGTERLRVTRHGPAVVLFPEIGLADYDSGKAVFEAPRDAAVLDSFKQRIFYKLHIPAHFEREGIAQPHAAAKEKGFKVCEKLFNDYSLIPATIRPTIEEGIYLSYDRITDNLDRTMIIEVYNTMEIALIVCDNGKKETIYIEDVKGMDFSRAVSVFKA